MASLSDEQYQNKFIHSLFTNSDNLDDEEEDEDSHISQHEWHCSETTSTSSIIYHLAFLAPGGDSVWNSSECIAQHLLLPEYRSTLFNNINTHDMNWPPQFCILVRLSSFIGITKRRRRQGCYY